MIQLYFPGIGLVVLHIATLGIVSRYSWACDMSAMGPISPSPVNGSIGFSFVSFVVSLVLVIHSGVLYQLERRIVSPLTDLLSILLVLLALGETICLGLSGAKLFGQGDTAEFDFYHVVFLFKLWAILWGSAILCMIVLLAVLVESRNGKFLHREDDERWLMTRRTIRRYPACGFLRRMSMMDLEDLATELEEDARSVELVDMESRRGDNHSDASSLVSRDSQ